MFEIENEFVLLSHSSLLSIECFEALVDVLSETRLVIEKGVDHLHLLEVLFRHL